MNRDNRIIDNLYEPLLRGAVAMLHDVDEAMDVVQEVFLFYCTKGDAWDSVEDVEGYLYGVMRNKCLNRIREKNHHATVDIASAETALRWEPGEELADLLRPLNTMQRRVVELHDIEGYSCEEIAARLGKSVAAVKKQLTRSRQRLRKSLENFNSKI